jgi:hypothetical protein
MNKSFQDRLSGLRILKWTREPARSAADSLRSDVAFGITSTSDILRAIKVMNQPKVQSRPKSKSPK